MSKATLARIAGLVVAWAALGSGFAAEPTGPAAFPRPKQIPYYAVKLPIAGGDCGGFFCAGGTFYLVDLANSRLYRLTGKDQLVLVDALPGQRIADATVVAQTPHYCAGNRLMVHTGGQVRKIPLAGAGQFASLTAGPEGLYLLDDKSRQILVLGPGYRLLRRLPAPGRQPRCLRFHDGALWLLDRQERCVRKLDPASGKPLARIPTGLRGPSRGIVFVDDRLYVHEIESSWLRLVEWRQVGPAVYSWPHEVPIQYIDDTTNASPGQVAQATFRVAVPTDGPIQQVGPIQWSVPPSGLLADAFGQAIAEFRGIAIPPGQTFRLAYTAPVKLVGVAYELEDVPLESLAKIPEPIRRTYLAPDPHLDMNTPLMQQLAAAARNDAEGNPPAGVRSLIENLAEAVMGRLSYVLDGKWERPTVVLPRGTGSCSEYSMVFSGLARLNGVPTRLIGGIQISEPGTKPYDTDLFHRWTEVWFPEVGWVPVDVTKIDGDRPESRDYDFFFGQPGYMVVLSRGGIDPKGLGMNYYARTQGRGGRREGKIRVHVEPWVGGPDYPVLELKL